MAYQVAVPDFRVELGGKEITSRFRPRLISLTLRESREDNADQVDIVLNDVDGKISLPRLGASLRVFIGWSAGSEVKVGLVDKGNYIVDEITAEGAPDTVTLRGRSADFTGDLKLRQERSFKATTLGAIVARIAGEHQLQPHCAPSLAGVQVDVHQSRESNMALLRRLGREHDAVATIKAGKLILSPIGAGTTAGGHAIATLSIARRKGDRHSYTLSKREEADAVSASWYDQDGGSKERITVGQTGTGKHRKHLSRTYASEGAARRAAAAELSRRKRDPAKMSVSLALGQPAIYPEQRVKLSGFKAQINATAWIVAEVEQSISTQGFTTSLQMESVA